MAAAIGEGVKVKILFLNDLDAFLAKLEEMGVDHGYR